jgi:dihydrofolate synthase / folylpolyglutamate synthase
MIIQPIKTQLVTPGMCSLADLLDEAILELPPKSVIAVAAKVVALCEGRAVPMENTDKEALIRQETDWYMPSASNPFNVAISVARGHLVAAGGIDESNGGDYYVLWPADLQASANMIREHLCKKHDIEEVGVIITDSTTRPFQRGTTGLGIAYSGFAPLKDYRGTNDLFGRPLVFQQNNIMNGLAAAAVVLTGEGDEQTPLAIITDLPSSVQFQKRNPAGDELAELDISLEEDLYAPLLRTAPWHKGDRSK